MITFSYRFQVLLCAALVFCSGWAQAQFNMGYQLLDVPVEENGQPLANPFAGGLNNPQYSTFDLNGDLHPDLVVFDRDGGLVRPFINGGTPNTIDYQYAPQYTSHFPKMTDFALFEDINCDGKTDILTHRSGSIAVYQNTTSNGQTLSYSLLTSALEAFIPATQINVPIFVLPTDIPAVTDVNGDGLLDILTFDQAGSFVQYYENVSDDAGGCSTVRFELNNACWGGFRESDNNHTVDLNQTCKGGSGRDGLHSGSTLLALDVDADGDRDLLLGDAGFDKMTMLTNGGDLQTAQMTATTLDFPPAQPIDLATFVAGFSLDVNNDELSDLVLAPNARNISRNLQNSQLYLNTAANAAAPPVFTYNTDRFLSDGMIDLGSGAHPVAMDVDGDGLQDLLVGNVGYYAVSGTFTSSIAYFRNTGTAAAPAFDLVTRDFGPFAQLNRSALHPTAGDVDDDGDLDLVVGDAEGNVHFFENNSLNGQANFSLQGPEWFGIDVNQFAAPQLADANRDGLLDLIIGERSGLVRYHKNTGTAQLPQFSATATQEELGGIDVRPQCCTGYSAPLLAELEEPGKWYLMVGAESGKVLVYDQVEGNMSGTFVLVDSIVTPSHRVNPILVNLNNDNTPELIIGNFSGGLSLLEKVIDAPVGTETVVQQPTLTVFPNPSSGPLTLSIQHPLPPATTLTIVDVLGRPVAVQGWPSGTTQITLDLHHLPAGMYSLLLETTNGLVTKHWMKNQ